MSTIIRDTFVALHSSNVLQKLHTEVCDERLFSFPDIDGFSIQQ